MTEELDDASFVERIARPLRAPEHTDSSFRARVMAAVHGMSSSQETETPRVSPAAGIRLSEQRPRSWWVRPYWIRITPVSSLVLAAALAIVAGGVVALRRTREPLPAYVPPAPVASAARVVHDTVHVVRFVFVDSSARSVSLVGEFNQWRKNAVVLRAGSQPGVWTADVPLTDGRHEYAFIVRDANGERWVADPIAPTHQDDFGTESSVISVGASNAS